MNGFNAIAINQATTSSISPTYHTYNLVNFSVMAVTNSTMSGTLSVQASNDFDLAGDTSGTFLPTNWATIASTVSSITGLGTTWLIPKFDTSYQYMRVQFVASSTAGTISVNVKGNGW